MYRRHTVAFQLDFDVDARCYPNNSGNKPDWKSGEVNQTEMSLGLSFGLAGYIGCKWLARINPTLCRRLDR